MSQGLRPLLDPGDLVNKRNISGIAADVRLPSVFNHHPSYRFILVIINTKQVSIISDIRTLKVWQQLYKNDASNTEQVLEAAPHKAAAVQQPSIHRENYQN